MKGSSNSDLGTMPKAPADAASVTNDPAHTTIKTSDTSDNLLLGTAITMIVAGVIGIPLAIVASVAHSISLSSRYIIAVPAILLCSTAIVCLQILCHTCYSAEGREASQGVRGACPDRHLHMPSYTLCDSVLDTLAIASGGHSYYGSSYYGYGSFWL